MRMPCHLRGSGNKPVGISRKCLEVPSGCMLVKRRLLSHPEGRIPQHLVAELRAIYEEVFRVETVGG